MRTTKNCAEKIQEPHETHQCDHVEAANYLRGAANVLESRGQARGAWKKDVVEFKVARRRRNFSSCQNPGFYRPVELRVLTTQSKVKLFSTACMRTTAT